MWTALRLLGIAAALGACSSPSYVPRVPPAPTFSHENAERLALDLGTDLSDKLGRAFSGENRIRIVMHESGRGRSAEPSSDWRLAPSSMHVFSTVLQRELRERSHIDLLAEDSIAHQLRIERFDTENVDDALRKKLRSELAVDALMFVKVLAEDPENVHTTFRVDATAEVVDVETRRVVAIGISNVVQGASDESP